ncbi:MAG: LysR family transcriptional regulator [Devosiaceae bacterium]|nr:LysR family transcriptional regulator [Devosiaceae bacterium MH13]
MSNFLDLEIFARVVGAGSMSAAARDMSLSPAVVSKRLRRLEDRLGTRLLQRTTRQIALTEAGKGFYERVVAILASVEEAESFVTRRSALASGVLKISAPTSFGRIHVAPHLAAFMAEHQDLTLQLELSDDFVDLVGEGFDVALRIAELNDSTLVARKLAPIHRVLCATPEYLAKHGTPESVEALKEHALLSTQAQESWRLEDGSGDPVTLKPSSAIITNSNEVIREAVMAGIGIALRSTWDVGPELSSGKLQIVLPRYRATRGVGLFSVYPTRRFLPAKVRVFIDYMASLYGPSPYWDKGLDPILNPVSQDLRSAAE